MSRYVFEGRKFENCVIFSNPKYGEIRMLIDNDGTKLFAGIDLASCMGYAAPSKAVMRCGIEGRVRMVPWVFRKRQGATDTRCFNESEAKLFVERGMIPPEGFKEWFFSEVLMQVREMKVERDVAVKENEVDRFLECMEPGIAPKKGAEDMLTYLDRVIVEMLTLRRALSGEMSERV